MTTFTARCNNKSQTVGIHAVTCNARHGDRVDFSIELEAATAQEAKQQFEIDQQTAERGIKVTICGCCKK